MVCKINGEVGAKVFGAVARKVDVLSSVVFPVYVLPPTFDKINVLAPRQFKLPPIPSMDPENVVVKPLAPVTKIPAPK
jgi:hypothetical protein